MEDESGGESLAADPDALEDAVAAQLLQHERVVQPGRLDITRIHFMEFNFETLFLWVNPHRSELTLTRSG